MSSTFVSLSDIAAARARIAPIAKLSPLIDVTASAGRSLWLKCESLQPGGAFKIGGAHNMISKLTDDQRQRGVITYSSGNHGQAVALAARTLGAPAVVVMPTTAPRIKIDGTRRHGAEIILEGTTTIHRLERAEREAAARGLTMVPPFDHEWIIAGQGTVGLEVLEQLPDVGTVLVPIGGGGLVSGVAAAIKLSKPSAQVVGVEPSGAASMKASIDAGHVLTLPRTHSIADGLMAVRPGDLNFAHVRRFVDRIVLVEDQAIADALVWLHTAANMLAEPSGATAVAAALAADAEFEAPVVAVISGGNLDPADLPKYRRTPGAVVE
jgi:threonine dehydratase